MSEKTDTENKIEEAFPKEDANTETLEQKEQTVKKTGGSFVKDPNDTPTQPQPKGPSLGDVLLYIGKEVHESKLIFQSIDKTLKSIDSKIPVPVVSTVIAPVLQPQTPTPPTQPQPSAPAPAPTPASAPVDSKLETLKTVFKEFIDRGELEINTTESTMFFVIRPLKFLGSENFMKIREIVMSNGGEYISQGKASHFKVPKMEKKP